VEFEFDREYPRGASADHLNRAFSAVLVAEERRSVATA
jgi:hypothetical protein